MDRVYEDYIDEQIPEELYKRKFDEFKAAKKALETQRKNIELDKEIDRSSVNRLLQLSNQAPKLFEMGNFEERRALINQVLSNLQLDGTLLRWKLKKPFDSMALCAETGNWLHTVEIFRSEHYAAIVQIYREITIARQYLNIPTVYPV